MASGNNPQQWGYTQFTQTGQAAGQGGNFINQGFADGDDDMNTNAFAMHHQWQSQDGHFMPDNGFSSYQTQNSNYPVQNLMGNNTHAQSHQHPQAYNTPIPVSGPSDMSWEYDFGFESNPIAGIGDGGITYADASSLQHGPDANALPNAPPFSQGVPNNMPRQQQYSAGHAPGGVYGPNQVSSFGRNTQHSPPQTMPQPIGQGPPMNYQQSSISHQPQTQPHPQPQPQPHSQPQPQHQAPVQHSHPASHHQHHSSQHQHSVAQHQHPLVQHHSAQHQQPSSLQAASHQLNRIPQNVNHAQPLHRTESPQSADHVAQARQSPFPGRNVPPFPLQQQAQHVSGPDGRGSPAIPFSAPPHPQQNSAQQVNPSIAASTPQDARTTQSRFVPQQMVPMQRPSPSPGSFASNGDVADPSGRHASSTPQQNTDSRFQNNVQPPTQSAAQQKASTQTTSTQPLPRGLGPPRILHSDPNSPMGSRYVAFTTAHALPIGWDPESNSTVDEIQDPAQVQAQPFGRFLPPGPSGHPRTLAFEALRHWTRAVEQDNVAVQNEWEQRLKKYLGKPRASHIYTSQLITCAGGSLPKYYEDKLQEARASRKKASGSRGPVSRI